MVKHRILFIAGWLWPWSSTGPSNVLHNILKELSLDNNLEITVCGTIPKGQRELVKHYMPPNIKLKLYESIWAQDGFFDTITAQLSYIYRILKEEPYDVVHFNILPGLRARYIQNIIKLKRRSTVLTLTLHDLPLLEAYNMSESKLKSIGLIVHWKLSENVMRQFNGIIVNSIFMYNHALKMGFSREGLHRIPNGICLAKPSNDLLSRTKLNFLCVGSFFPKKGQDILIKAFNLTKAKDHSHLYLVGKKTYFQEQCIKIADDLCIHDRISFLSGLSRDELLNLIKQADVYIQPSQWEGFGIAILEAMSYGKPVIATNVGGVPDFVIDGENGLLVDPRRIDLLSCAIDNLAFNNQLRVQLGQKAYLTSIKYTWKSIAPLYSALFRALLSDSPIKSTK